MNRRQLEVCLCTPDLAGEVGAAYLALAQALADAGHRATVLYSTGPEPQNRSFQFLQLPPPKIAIVNDPHVRASLQCYQWLADREAQGKGFDIIHFPEQQGLGFYSVLAKKQGLNFASTVFSVDIYGPHLWHLDGMCDHPNAVEDLQADWLERGSVRHADVVISPTRYMLDWMKKRGWQLPADADVLQPVLSSTKEIRPAGPIAIKQIVFFNRLETRKGLTLFCDAMDVLARDPKSPPMEVIFLGRQSEAEGLPSAEYLKVRGQDWPFAWKVIDDLDDESALDFLREGSRLAVVPSLVENLSLPALQCLGNGIPLICTDLPAHREWIAAANADGVVFVPKAADLAKCIWNALVNGVTPVYPAIMPEQTKRAWIAWHQQIAASHPGPEISAEKPLVSVCLTHFNRPEKLGQALDSLRAQEYANFEVILVDDGSDQAEALRFLGSLSDEFKQRNWKLIRQPNRYLGAARNAAVRAANGKWLLFMDDDNFAMADEISTFVRAAQCSGADVLTCVAGFFEGDAAPNFSTPRTLNAPLGGAAEMGLFSNCFGDANGFFRREVFEKLGGFTEEYGVGYEDCELYAKAALAGFQVMVVPKSLFWYRVDPRSMVRTTSLYANRLRAARPYMDRLPPELRHLPLLLQGMQFQRAPGAPPLLPRMLQRADTIARRQICTELFGPRPPQELVDHFWDSFSMRLPRLLFGPMARILGRSPSQRPVVTTYPEAMTAIEQIRKSLSWELTGFLRAAARMFRGNP